MSKKFNKLILDENFDNVPADAQPISDVGFVGANEEHDDNKKKYEDAIAENEKLALETIPKEGDTGKKVTSKVLKKMHLSEALFDDETPKKEQKIKEFLSTKIRMGDKAIEALVRNIIFDNDNQINWDKAYEKMLHFMPETELSNIDESLNESPSFMNYKQFLGTVKEVESGIPNNMRYKEVDYQSIDSDNDTLYWVTQEPFSEEDLREFQHALEDTNFKYALVILRDDSKGFVDDLRSGRGELLINNSMNESLNESVSDDPKERLLNYLMKYQRCYEKCDEDFGDALINIGKTFKSFGNKVEESLKENYYVVDLDDGSAFGNYSSVEDAKVKALQYATQFRRNAAVVDDTTQHPVQGYNSSGKTLMTESLKEDISARPNHDKLLDMVAEGLISYEFLAENLMRWLPDTELGEFMNLYDLEYPEVVEESIQFAIAKEQLSRFNEGKMPKNWNPESFLNKLLEAKSISKSEFNTLKESLK